MNRVIRKGALSKAMKWRIRGERGDRHVTVQRKPQSLWDQYFALPVGSPEAVELLQQIRRMPAGS